LGSTDAELSILLVDDAAMRLLNREWRGLDRTTDVLSFAQREGQGPGDRPPTSLLGDVVVSLDAARRQSRRFGHPLERELARLLVHGILHLVGHDHVRGEKRAREMRHEERRLLRLLAAGRRAEATRARR